MWDLDDRTVVITGAASGIGRATAEAFLDRGAFVYGVDVDRGGLDRLRGELRSREGRGAGSPARGDHFVAHVADVRDEGAMADLAKEVFQTRGRVDVLHLNAGVMIGGRVQNLGIQDWRRAVEINLGGVINGVWAFVPRMMRQGGGGHLVATASIGGLVGFPCCGPYAASKFGVVGLCEALGAELSPAQIRVTAICPGMVRTSLLEHGKVELPGQGRGLLEKAMARYALSPAEVAREVLRVVEGRKGGIRVMGLGTRPLWWLHRAARGSYGAAMGALCRQVLGKDEDPPGARDSGSKGPAQYNVIDDRRRGARGARREEGEYRGVFNRRATPPRGMDRRGGRSGCIVPSPKGPRENRFEAPRPPRRSASEARGGRIPRRIQPTSDEAGRDGSAAECRSYSLANPHRGWGVLIAHPSGRQEAREAMAELAERLSRDRPGYLLWTLGTPTDSVVDHARRAARIAPPESGFRLVPLLVAPGAHFHKDVAALAEAVALAAPTLRPVVLPAFLQDGDFVSWFLSRLP